jgi:hypothetical protein
MVRMARPDDSYSLPEPELRAYDHGLGTLSVDGELRGYLACVVGRLTFPSRGPWPWFRSSGRMAAWSRFEDYGPEWWTVRELESGKLEYHGRITELERRVRRFAVRTSTYADGESRIAATARSTRSSTDGRAHRSLRTEARRLARVDPNLGLGLSTDARLLW